jgi:NitT/TauT family transport system substrate-binding protein
MARKTGNTGKNRTLDRRGFIKKAAVGTAVVAASTSSIPRRVFTQTRKEISFTLPWLPNGGSAFVYVTKDKGFWSKRGIDATISRGFGSVASAQAIGQNKFDFGLSAAPANYLQIVKGMKILNLACCNYDPTMGVMYLETTGIKSPKDLEGTKMACTVASGEFPFLPVFAERSGFDWSKVSVVQVDNKIRTSVLLSGKTDSMSGFATSSMPSIITKGYPIRAFLYSAFGMPFYGQMLITQPERMAKDKGLCEAVTEGCLESIKWAMLNPEETHEIFFKNVKEAALTKTGRKSLAIEFGMFSHINIRPEVAAHGVGYVDQKAYSEMAELILKYLAKPEDKVPPMETVYTNEFSADRFKFSDAEWNQVKELTKPYANFLS